MSTSDLSAEIDGSRTGYLIDVDGQERAKKVVQILIAISFVFDELLYVHSGVSGDRQLRDLFH